MKEPQNITQSLYLILIGYAHIHTVTYCKSERMQRRSVEQINAAVDKLIPSDEFDARYSSLTLPTIEFLPQRYVLEVGPTVIVRSARRDDMQRLYGVMKTVVESGQGYGADEFPTFSAFFDMISDSYVIVVEEDSASRKVRIHGHSWSDRPR